ncbi:hypothetical protein VZT92_011683 [Zoarces viviparus]|uniref:alpha-N-acetylgalactosaminide alpha-2,6-sialyltransferase n=1 Tax=Zoarces viviparus TaxID=48416 RepID=A0AAW1F6D6_ZOAVI
MAIQTFRGFSLLLVISVCTVLIFLTFGHLSSIGWNAFSGLTRQVDEEMVGSGEVEENLTKIADSTKTNGAEVKSDQTSRTTPGAVPETPMPVLSRKSFKKAPRWDFDDIYNQDAPPRQTTCAESLRNSEDEGFKKAFLPNVRMFMHRTNMSEWNRLSHFNNPFGFMEYKHDEVMLAVNLIPKPNEPLLPPKTGSDKCLRCAVVATGGILNGSKMGKEIDAHDYVFRMNGAAIKGYEEDVGNRTSVYVHTAHSITMSLKLWRKFGYTSAPKDEGIKYVLIPEGMRDFLWMEGLFKGERVTAGQFKNNRPRNYYSGQYNETRFYVLHQDFLRYVRNRFLNSPHLNSSFWPFVRPTNGAFTIFLALQTCDTVSAYGFMTEDFRKYSTYYVEKFKSNVVLYPNHDYIMEKNLWKRLHDSKIINLYQKTLPEKGSPSVSPKH